MFSPEETAVPVRVLIPDDNIVEPTETFHVSTDSTQATVFVLDNDGQLCVCVCASTSLLQHLQSKNSSIVCFSDCVAGYH